MGHHGSGQEVEVEIIDDDQYEDDQDRAAFEEIMPGLPVEMVQFPLFVSAVSWLTFAQKDAYNFNILQP